MVLNNAQKMLVLTAAQSLMQSQSPPTARKMAWTPLLQRTGSLAWSQ